MSQYPFNTDYFNDMTEPQLLTFKEFNDLIKVMSTTNSRTSTMNNNNINNNNNNNPIINQQMSAFSFARSSSPKYAVLSDMEAAILRSTSPIEINETEEIEVNGQRGIWLNKCEQLSWRGEIPITEYSINQDQNPEVIKKNIRKQLDYVQELAIRYLKPPTPPSPGEIIIKLEPNTQVPPAPPLIIRQQPPRPPSPAPLVIREEPPKPPTTPGRKLIRISGKKLPPPPRKVVIERLAPLPAKPQSVIIERWLPYQENLKRRVIFQRAPPDPVLVKPKNVIIQWEQPNVVVKKNLKYLGTIKADPIEYANRYAGSLRQANDLPQFVKEITTPEGLVLAADYQPQTNQVHELVGDVEALKLVDLEREGLSEYRQQLDKFIIENASPNTTTSINNSNHAIVPTSDSISPFISASNSGSASSTSNINNLNNVNNNNNNNINLANTSINNNNNTINNTNNIAPNNCNHNHNTHAPIYIPQPTVNNNYKSSDEEAEKILSRLNSRLRDSNGRRLIADPSLYYLV